MPNGREFERVPGKHGVLDRHIRGPDQQADVGRRGDVRRQGRVVAAADRDAVHGRAGGGNLHAAGDDGFGPARAVAGNPVIGALEGDVLVDVDMLAVGAGRDPDGVAGHGGVDRRRDGGVAAIADEQDVMTAAIGDLLDAGERVGALGTTGVDDEVAEAIFGQHRAAERPGVDRGVGAGAADQGIAAAAAAERVVAALAVEGVVAAVAGEDVRVTVAGAVDIGAAGQGQVLDIGAERVADRRLHRVGALVERLRHHVAGIVDHVAVVAGTAGHGVGAGPAVDRVGARTCGDNIGAVAAVDDEAAGRTGVGNQRVAVVVEGHRHRRLGDIVDVAVQRTVHRVGDADVGHLHRRTGNILARLAGTDAGRGAVDGAVGNDHGAGIGGRRCTVGRPVVASLHGDGAAAEVRSSRRRWTARHRSS